MNCTRRKPMPERLGERAGRQRLADARARPRAARARGRGCRRGRGAAPRPCRRRPGRPASSTSPARRALSSIDSVGRHVGRHVGRASRGSCSIAVTASLDAGRRHRLVGGQHAPGVVAEELARLVGVLGGVDAVVALEAVRRRGRRAATRRRRRNTPVVLGAAAQQRLERRRSADRHRARLGAGGTGDGHLDSAIDVAEPAQGDGGDRQQEAERGDVLDPRRPAGEGDRHDASSDDDHGGRRCRWRTTMLPHVGVSLHRHADRLQRGDRPPRGRPRRGGGASSGPCGRGRAAGRPRAAGTSKRPSRRTVSSVAVSDGEPGDAARGGGLLEAHPAGDDGVVDRPRPRASPAPPRRRRRAPGSARPVAAGPGRDRCRRRRSRCIRRRIGAADEHGDGTPQPTIAASSNERAAPRSGFALRPRRARRRSRLEFESRCSSAASSVRRTTRRLPSSASGTGSAAAASGDQAERRRGEGERDTVDARPTWPEATEGVGCTEPAVMAPRPRSRAAASSLALARSRARGPP